MKLDFDSGVASVSERIENMIVLVDFVLIAVVMRLWLQKPAVKMSHIDIDKLC